MQLINKDSVETRFIKNLLRNTYLPLVPTIHTNEYMIKDILYTYKGNIIKCTKSGAFLTNGTSFDGIYYVDRHKKDNTEPTKQSPTASTFALCGPSFICGMGKVIAEYKTVDTFKADRYTPGVTSTFNSASVGYDTETHKQLGRYLRWFRDTYNMDLLGLYNNFAGESISGLHLEQSKIVDGNSTQYTTWIVPAYLNTTYTIYLNSASAVTVRGAFLSNGNRIKTEEIKSGYVDALFDDNVIVKSSPTSTQPFVYSTTSEESLAFKHLNNFYLLIQTNKTFTGPIVVLEGNYLDANMRHKQSIESTASRFDTSVPKIKPSLSVLGAITPMLYSDRLIEFLAQNVIGPQEDIQHNIQRIQSKLNLVDATNHRKDLWDDSLRHTLYYGYFNYKNSYYFDTAKPSAQDVIDRGIPDKYAVYTLDAEGKPTGELLGLKNCEPHRDFGVSYDITGYVDKDIENSLYKYRSV